MNKLYSVLLGSAFVLSISTQAQITSKTSEVPHAVFHATPEISDGSVIYSRDNESSNLNSQAEALGDTIFNEDFAAGIGSWTNSAAGATTAIWEYRGPNTSPNRDTGSIGQWTGAGPSAAVNSPTRLNGFMIFDSDYYDTRAIGSGLGQFPLPHDAYLTSPVINLTNYNRAILTYTQSLRMFTSQMMVEVSDDNFVTIDTLYNAYDEYSANISSPVDEFIKLDVSAFGGSATFQVRFHFTSNTPGQSDGLYFWMIDDIMVLESPEFDLTFNQQYYQGAGSFAANVEGELYYTQIPEKQADFDTVQLGAAILNSGNSTMTGSELSTAVTGPNGFTFNSSSSSSTILSGASDSVDAANTMIPNGGIGTYDLTFTISADSVDDFPDDNTFTSAFDVTETVYARDDNNVGGGTRWGAAGTNGCFVRYDINRKDTIIAVEVVFYNSDGANPNPDFRTDVNSVVEVGVWGIPAGGVPATFDVSTAPIISQPFYTISSSVPLNQWVRIAMPTPTEIDPAVFSEVLVGYRVRSGYVTLATTNQDAVFNQNYVDSDGDNVLNGWTSNTFTPRLVLSPPASVCASRSFAISGTVNDNSATGSIVLDSTVITSPSAPFSFVWSGPNGFIATTKDISNLTDTGLYTVVVSDADGCAGVGGAFSVANCVGLAYSANIGFASNGLTSNPNSNNTPYTYNWTGPGGFSATSQNAPITAIGVYTLVVTDGNGCSTSESITIDSDADGNLFPLAVENNIAEGTPMKVYPNPASGTFKIDLANEGEYSIELIDMLGKVVLKEQNKAKTGQTIEFKTEKLNRGMYLLIVGQQGISTTERLILK